LERIRCHQSVRYGPEWTTTRPIGNESLHRHLARYASVGCVGDSRLSELGSSRRQLRYRSVVGRTSRQRDRQSPAWKTTAIVIVWDDWGGWYDHVPPRVRVTTGGSVPRAGDRRFAVFKDLATSLTITTSLEAYKVRRGKLATAELGTTDKTPRASSKTSLTHTQQPAQVGPNRLEYPVIFLHQLRRTKPATQE